MARKSVAVLGGGITGLAAAWELAQSSSCDVRLYEAGPRVGGVLETIYEGDYLIERSADNFATLVPDALQLAKEIGYSDHLISPQSKGRQAFVLHGGRILPIPAGFSLMQPTRMASIATTRTLSWSGKFRLAAEFFVRPNRTAVPDESLESFATRRLGREAYENLVEPIVSGIFTADPKTLSMRATLPQFLEMEQRHGGLIRGHLHARRNDAQAAARRASGARYDQFLAPRLGMSHWINHLADALPHGCISLNQQVIAVELSPAAPASPGDATSPLLPQWRIRLSDGQETIHDAVLIALPTAIAANLIEPLSAEASELVKGIQYASSAVVAMIIDRADLTGRTDGFGLIVPRKEKRAALAISYTSNKYPGRTPDGQLLTRIFLGGAMNPEVMELADAQIEQLAEREIRDILGWTAKQSRWQAVIRWKNAMPQYTVGHVDRWERVQKLLAPWPTLKLCGAGYAGVGIPQCVRSGRGAARQVVAQFGSAMPPSAKSELS